MEAVLCRINEAMADLGLGGKMKTIPKRIEGTGIEKTRIVLVDDCRLIIATMLPCLMANLREAAYIHYKGQSFEEVTRQIIESNPNLVLLDYNLGNEVNGGMLAQMLISRNYGGIIIGLSSGVEAKTKFASVGVVEYINKSASGNSDLIAQLATIVAKYN